MEEALLQSRPPDASSLLSRGTVHAGRSVAPSPEARLTPLVALTFQAEGRMGAQLVPHPQRSSWALPSQSWTCGAARLRAELGVHTTRDAGTGRAGRGAPAAAVLRRLLSPGLPACCDSGILL